MKLREWIYENAMNITLVCLVVTIYSVLLAVAYTI